MEIHPTGRRQGQEKPSDGQNERDPPQDENHPGSPAAHHLHKRLLGFPGGYVNPPFTEENAPTNHGNRPSSQPLGPKPQRRVRERRRTNYGGDEARRVKYLGSD
ncbi:hypothetical protein HPB52_023359 [Rhipicephalus sanguineus]|uniref:Uncharacterized protein n=1 Tax=Rhipicephalus sanguineus TaxID=34632 RepID=A0A9D4QCG0_RHISA|nr:hypothetical protein HPB52_023359 [Rhipicephalus sanguineus]